MTVASRILGSNSSPPEAYYEQESNVKYNSGSLQRRFRATVQKALVEKDCWAKYDISSLNIERATRHLYDPQKHGWSSEDCFVKMEPTPFDRGAMRQCFRMKKIAQIPNGASNHHFHRIDWEKCPNYVAKCYASKEGIPDTRNKTLCFEAVMLQYEASHWAGVYNKAKPSKTVDFIRCFVLELQDRPNGSNIFTVERFLSGNDVNGSEFIKYSNNAGLVNQNLQRQTPQVFSAYSFYASRGTRLVTDIQGLGDLYTDPQIHSIESRYGHGDLGPFGMALFFLSFHQTSYADAMGIPAFFLSRNELIYQQQLKNEHPTDASLSLQYPNQSRDGHGVKLSPSKNEALDFLSLLSCKNTSFDYLTTEWTAAADLHNKGRKPLIPDEVTKHNIGEVHYQLAVFHGSESVYRYRTSTDRQTYHPVHDLESCLFHLAHAASFRHVRACLILGRILSGTSTTLSKSLKAPIPTDLETAKVLLRRGMEPSNFPVAASLRCAIGCRLIQVLKSHEDIENDSMVAATIEEVLKIYQLFSAHEENVRVEMDGVDDNETLCFQRYQLKIQLADLRLGTGDINAAVNLLEDAANDANAIGKLQMGKELRQKVKDILALEG